MIENIFEKSKTIEVKTLTDLVNLVEKEGEKDAFGWKNYRGSILIDINDKNKRIN